MEENALNKCSCHPHMTSDKHRNLLHYVGINFKIIILSKCVGFESGYYIFWLFEYKRSRIQSFGICFVSDIAKPSLNYVTSTVEE